jgi:hypothetical protein
MEVWWKLICSLCTYRASPAHDASDLTSRLSAELVSQHSQRSLSYTCSRPVSPETEPRSRSFDHQRDESGVDKGNLAVDQSTILLFCSFRGAAVVVANITWRGTACQWYHQHHLHENSKPYIFILVFSFASWHPRHFKKIIHIPLNKHIIYLLWNFLFILFLSPAPIVLLHNFFEQLHQLYLLCSVCSINYSAFISTVLFTLHNLIIHQLI